MPKLYYTTTSCGASNFIAAFIAGLSIEAETVELATHKTATGVDFYTINPKGNVPTIVLDDGTVLNENAATLQWIADQVPGAVAPVAGTVDRYKVVQALSYISSEVHSTIGALFYPNDPIVLEWTRKKLATKLQYLNDHLLRGKHYLVGDSFTIADSYLFIVLSWTGYLQVDLAPYPNVKAYFESIASLPIVQEAQARLATTPLTTR